MNFQVLRFSNDWLKEVLMQVNHKTIPVLPGFLHIQMFKMILNYEYKQFF